MESYKTRDGKGVIGKASLDTLCAAVTSVIADYQKAYGRNPTIGELEALLTHAVDRHEVGVVTGVTIALAEAGPYDDADD